MACMRAIMSYGLKVTKKVSKYVRLELGFKLHEVTVVNNVRSQEQQFSNYVPIRTMRDSVPRKGR